jgi:hypothetical protein
MRYAQAQDLLALSQAARAHQRDDRALGRVIIEIEYAQSIQGAIYSVVRDDKMPHSSARPPAAMTAVRQLASAPDRPSSFGTALLQSNLSWI